MFSHRLIIHSRCIRSTGHSRYTPLIGRSRYIRHNRALHRIPLRRVKVAGVRKGTIGKTGTEGDQGTERTR